MLSTCGGTRKRATVLVSGGIDSAACVHFLKKQDFEVGAIFVDYGQAARIHEAQASVAVAEYFGIHLRSCHFDGATSSGPGELVGRNAMLIFCALFAIRGWTGLLSLGIHAGTPYYDCSNSFVDAAARLVSEHTDGCVALYTPFLNWSKLDVYNFFRQENLPFEHTYSCEAGGDPPCGRCASCHDRAMFG